MNLKTVQIKFNNNNMNLTFDECKNFEGYLMKKSPRFFLIEVFQKRYFKILDGKLMIYMDKKEGEIKGQISFNQISSIQIEKEDFIFSFNFNERKFILKADSNELRDKWVYIINLLVNKNKINNNNYIETNSNRIKNKIEDLTKSKVLILNNHGYQINKEEELESNNLLSIFKIDELLSLKAPKIQDRIYHSFIYFENIKMWLFIFSSRPLDESKYLEDEKTLKKNILKKWLKFDTLFIFNIKYNKIEKEIDLKNCFKIEKNEDEKKYFILLDLCDNIIKLYYDKKFERDKWFEILKISRKTAKEFKNSITKHPRNVEKLYKLFKENKYKCKEKFNDEVNHVLSQTIDNFNILKEYLEILSENIFSTIDGCISHDPPLKDLLEEYCTFNNKNMIKVICKFWEDNYSTLTLINLIYLAELLFNYNKNLKSFKIIDKNFDNNALVFIHIYFKNLQNELDENIKYILKKERETKYSEDKNKNLKTNGIGDLFNLLFIIFDELKKFHYKELYLEFCGFVREILLKYIQGLDCVISNKNIILDNKFNIAIANNSIEFLFKFKILIEKIIEEKILIKDEIEKSMNYKIINNLITLLTDNAIINFINEYSEKIREGFVKKNLKNIEINKILEHINNLFKPFFILMNSVTKKKCLSYILKETVYNYLNVLFFTKTDFKKIQELKDKINNDHQRLFHVYNEFIGENTSNLSLNYMKDVINFLEGDFNNIKKSCQNLRNFIGPGFKIDLIKKIIKNRSDLNKQEKNNIIDSCNMILQNAFFKLKKSLNIQEDFSNIINNEIKQEIIEEQKMANQIEFDQNTLKTSLMVVSINDFLKTQLMLENNKNNNNNENDNENELNVNDEGVDILSKGISSKNILNINNINIISDVIKEGKICLKNEKNIFQEKYCQIKNDCIYIFNKQFDNKYNQKIDLNYVLKVDILNNKFFITIDDGSFINFDKNENPIENKIQTTYEFKCKDEIECKMWATKIKEELDKIDNKKKSNYILEIPVRKNIIRDLYNKPNSTKNILIMKDDILKDILIENYFEIKKNKTLNNKKINIKKNIQEIKNNVNNNNNENKINTSKEIKQYNINDFLKDY